MNKVTDGEGRNGIKGQFREADRSLHFFQSRIVCPRRFPMNRLFLPSLLSHLNNLVSLDFSFTLAKIAISEFLWKTLHRRIRNNPTSSRD